MTATGETQSASSALPITLSVPYYSGFDLLRETLRSIAKQTYPACRVLLCDDSLAGLSANQQAELTSIVGHVFAFRVLRNEQNLGMARTWNRCLDQADSDLVTLVHGDDELEPGYAAAMVRLMARHPEAAAGFCGASIIGREGQAKFSFPDLYKQLLIPRHGEVLELRGDRALNALMRGNFIFCPSICYRRSQLLDHRFDRQFRMVLDMDLTTRLLLGGQTLVGLPDQNFYRYRRHDDNATEVMTKELTRFTEESALYLDIAQRARALGFTRAARTAEQQRIIKLNLLFCLARDLLNRNWQDGGRKLKLLRTLFERRARS